MLAKGIRVPMIFRRFGRGDLLLFAILLVDVAILAVATEMFTSELVRRVITPKQAQSLQTAKKSPAAAAFTETKRVAVVEDFSAYPANLIKGESGVFENDGAICRDELFPSDDGNFLKITYDVTAPDSSCGFLTELKGVQRKAFSAVEFSICGEKGDEVFSVELDQGGHEDRVPLRRYIPGELPLDWKRVRIPLKHFPAAAKAAVLNGCFALAFDHAQGEPYRGMVYIKDIRFVE